MEKPVEEDAGCSPGAVLGRLSSHTLLPHHCSCRVTALRPLVRIFGNFVICPWLTLLPSSPRVWHGHN